MSRFEFPSDHNVLSMDRSASKLRKIERYWNEVRGNRLVPSRCEIDPRGLEGVLSNSFVLERLAGGLARFRIAGAHLTEFTGLELRQMPISALFLPDSREILSDALQAAFEEPAIIRMSIMSPAGFGRDLLKGEMILLPLRSDLGDIDRILGGIVFEGKTGRTPRRIEIVSQQRQSLVGFAGPNPAVRDNLPAPEPRLPASDTRLSTVTPARPSRRRETGRGHLRLVVSND